MRPLGACRSSSISHSPIFGKAIYTYTPDLQSTDLQASARTTNCRWPRLTGSSSKLASPTFMRLSHKRSLLFLQQNGRGFALVLVLAFTALLTGLALAFLSNSLGQRQVAHASADQEKVSLLADGATDMVAGYLQAEIASPSKSTTITLSDGTKIYMPITPQDMVPSRDSAWQGNAALNNLVKISGQTFYTDVSVPASNTDTTVPSANGRYIDNTRWLKPLFLPTGTNLPVAPDWIEVKAAPNGTGTSTDVVGRYAFVVYDEGGLLDLNVAGYPNTDVATKWDHTVDPAYKSALAYADLTQIPGVTQANINDLVSWRNAASVTSPGYKTYVESNRTGFLRTANTDLSAGKSDEMFTGRQQMISLLTGKLGWTKDTLQYFTSYSRDLNQPSLAPDHTKLPQLQSLANGGNDQVQSDYDTLNPKFLLVRVQSAFTRNDGTPAAVGDPLVKQRFALNRLIWLTYNGPSQGRTGSDIKDLKDNLGVTQEWLDQGTDTNIQKYFGLHWDKQGFWTYSPISGGNTRILTLHQIANLNREPNFIELLKASITTGALGKSAFPSGASGTVPNYGSPAQTQYVRDIAIDNQIIQIAANIIDQSDVDGYPTRIQFNGNGVNQEFRGIENLPYFYRTRNALYKLKNPNPYPPNTGNSIFYDYSSAPTDSGTCIMVQQPEIWNPHFYYPATSLTETNRLLGFPRPGFSEGTAGSGSGDATALQLVVYMGHPGVPNPISQGGQFSMVTHTRDYGRGGSNYPDQGGPYPYHSTEKFFDPLTDKNTLMTFSNEPDLYREPTLLIKPGIPTGSSLSAPGLNNIPAIHQFITSVGGNIGVSLETTNDDDIPSAYTGLQHPPTGAAFLGIFLGENNVVFPQDSSSNRYWFASSASISGLQGGLLYQLRYVDSSGTPVVYDEKYFSPSLDSERLPSTLSLIGRQWNVNGYRVRSIISADQIMGCFDPRTSRFGVLFSPCADFDTDGGSPRARAREFPPRSRSAWIGGNPAFFADDSVTHQNVTVSDRPDLNAGFGFVPPSVSTEGTETFSPEQTYAAHYATQEAAYPPTNSKGWHWNLMLRPGLFSQNSISAVDNGHVFGNPAKPSDYSKQTTVTLTSTDTQPQYYSDPDGVVRRGMGAYVTNSTIPSLNDTSGSALGLPTPTTALYLSAQSTNPGIQPNANQMASRPVILNRPFRSVGELSSVFSDTPWKDLDFSTPESGFSPLLDTFCVSDSDNSDALVAGKVNLNTRQKPVIQAILAGAYRSTYTNLSSPLTTPENISQTDATSLAALLVDNRTQSTQANKGPLTNLTDLVGGLKTSSSLSAPIDGSQQYTGFSSDVGTIMTNSTDKIPRYRESAIRGLSSVGTTRTWNLMIDLIAQSGHYPGGTTSSSFVVEGEQRYWVHLSIDRLTGKILDKKVELVKE